MEITYKSKKGKKIPNEVAQKLVDNSNANYNTTKSVDNFIPNEISNNNFSSSPIFSNPNDFSIKNHPNLSNIQKYRSSIPKEQWLNDCKKGGLMAGKTRRLEVVAQKILHEKANATEKALMRELGEEIDDEADSQEILLRCAKNYGENGNVKYAELLLKASGEMPDKNSANNLVQINTGVEKVMNIFDTINEIQFNND